MIRIDPPFSPFEKAFAGICAAAALLAGYAYWSAAPTMLGAAYLEEAATQ